MANLQFNERNPWNPFEPTKRDIDRSETLGKKSQVAVGLLGILISPIISAIYLNRAANSLKIAGYTFALVIVISLGASDEDEAFSMGLGAGFIGNIVIMSEQFMAVSSARKRQPVEKKTVT
ncbi:hypothetical protein C7B62_15405 [Pleurocapsa sp. CCALA 161]|uniref:hypothetical protein n=1 Tax=Pleurocapsa sp. CCALA 161 TaxID=2107688 RepID=UPI000D065ADD|nr:hypothetical protein [Pleurocapsa sp. CCALA 161]PSB08825.1 hypothetical protein C7B62_15405 [Pleurocapsa sp. CCALA 161]